MTSRAARASRGKDRAKKNVRACLADNGQVRWERTAITLHDQVKGGFVTAACMRKLRRLGCPPDELNLYWPPMLHLEALVYRGDLGYEHEQATGAQAPTTWREGIEEIIKSYGFLDERILKHLNSLEEYMHWECATERDSLAPGTEEIARSCYGRSSDLRLLLRFGHRMARIPEHQGYFDLLRHSHAMGEIRDDLSTYAKDVAQNSFNVYRLCVRGAAHHEPRATICDVWQYLRDAFDRELAEADRRTLVLFVRTLLPLPRVVSGLRGLPLHQASGSLASMIPRTLLLRYMQWRLRRSGFLSMPALPEAIDEPVRPTPGMNLETA
jgi:hypothetical protein